MNAKKLSKIEQLELLKKEGFQVVRHSSLVGHKLSDGNLAEYLNAQRDSSRYAIDGIVIDVNDASVRDEMNPTRDTLNPPYSIKYKVADADNLAIGTVKAIHLAVSKHGYIKPTIEIEPVELGGVTISRCTGFNMRFIYDNKIQPGCQIEIIRAGEVIPTVLGIIKAGELK